jgi:hypothetical protein
MENVKYYWIDRMNLCVYIYSPGNQISFSGDDNEEELMMMMMMRWKDRDMIYIELCRREKHDI